MKETIIYTDGSCSGNPGPGGWAAIILTPEGRVRELGGARPQTTNNRMELRAVIAALAATTREPAPISIHTDSTYILGAVAGWLARWKRNGFLKADGKPVLNRDLWEELDHLVLERSRHGPTAWRHVRGHAGIPGNERSDAIALSFALGKPVNLYDGPESGYAHDLRCLSAAS